jgi:hypothetical protein
MESKESSVGSRVLSRRGMLTGAAGLASVAALGVTTAAPAFAAQQGDWRWCNRCQCLFYGGNYTTGWCVRGGGHNYEGSGEYLPHYNYQSGQDDWRWCHKCQSMWYGGGKMSAIAQQVRGTTPAEAVTIRSNTATIRGAKSNPGGAGVTSATACAIPVTAVAIARKAADTTSMAVAVTICPTLRIDVVPRYRTCCGANRR